MIGVGDKIKFVDKYGVLVRGIYRGIMHEMEAHAAIVEANAFGDGKIIKCLIPYEAMEPDTD
jgi:hypothetical protein